MGYRDDFYVIGNIIGHTGSAHSDPTVYFQQGNEYGHITQAHRLKENVGREVVSQHANYTIGNQLINGSLRCVEKEGNDVVHTSRSTYVPVANLSAVQIKVLGQAVINFTGQKPINAIFGQAWNDLVYGPQIQGADVTELIRRYPVP